MLIPLFENGGRVSRAAGTGAETDLRLHSGSILLHVSAGDRREKRQVGLQRLLRNEDDAAEGLSAFDVGMRFCGVRERERAVDDGA